ncbi:MAG TPA: class I SAM-dependent methyltransferase, partial [Bacteroidetes bacterium]|nr:class I SAM-dependent methyltransferase [Bacteroidota bacterium]
MKNDHIKEAQETWDAIAKSFDSTRHKIWKPCMDFIESLPKDSVVLDIACGNGRHLIFCAKHCKKVVGLDVSMEMLKIVQ